MNMWLAPRPNTKLRRACCISAHSHSHLLNARMPLTHPHSTSTHTQTVHGEIGENPLETLAAISQDVFVPMLTSPVNQQGWPDVVAKEVTENLHKFVSNGEQETVIVAVVKGKGQAACACGNE